MLVLIYDAAVVWYLVRELWRLVSTIHVDSSAWAALAAFAAAFTVLEMRQDRRSRERPYVVADFDVQRAFLLFFRLRNLGGGPAFDVRLTFNPVPADWNGTRLSDVSIFQHPIPVLAQGDQTVVFLGTTVQVLNGPSPRSFAVTVTARGEAGYRFRRVYRIDFETIRGLVMDEPILEERLQAIERNIEKIDRTFEHVIKGGALVTEDYSKNRERIEANMEEMRKRRSASEAESSSD